MSPDPLYFQLNAQLYAQLWSQLFAQRYAAKIDSISVAPLLEVR